MGTKVIQHHHAKAIGKRKKEMNTEKVEDSCELKIIKNYILHNLIFFFFKFINYERAFYIVKNMQIL